MSLSLDDTLRFADDGRFETMLERRAEAPARMKAIVLGLPGIRPPVFQAGGSSLRAYWRGETIMKRRAA